VTAIAVSVDKARGNREPTVARRPHRTAPSPLSRILDGTRVRYRESARTRRTNSVRVPQRSLGLADQVGQPQVRSKGDPNTESVLQDVNPRRSVRRSRFRTCAATVEVHPETILFGAVLPGHGCTLSGYQRAKDSPKRHRIRFANRMPEDSGQPEALLILARHLCMASRGARSCKKGLLSFVEKTTWR